MLSEELKRGVGRPRRSFAERASVFDAALQRFLEEHPGANVVSLGEGLETQRYRVAGYGRWTTVDLPEVIAVRNHLVTPDERHVHRAESATTLAWIPDLGRGPAYVVAQGLFMYLPSTDVGRILRALSDRHDVGIMFDVVPRWVSSLSQLRPSIGRSLRLPRMPWGAGPRRLEREVHRWVGRPTPVELTPLRLPSGPGQAHAVRLVL